MYKIVSLGSNCFTRRILTLTGIKPSRQEGELSLPFDLVVTSYDAVVDFLENGFGDYFNDLVFDIDAHFWINKKYNIYFSHDADCTINDKDKLIQRFKQRINNFNKVIESEEFVYFVYCPISEIDKNSIEYLYNVLKKSRAESTFKLIILDFFASKVSTELNNIVLLHIAHPYKDFNNEWWNNRSRLTEEGKLFEKSVAEKIKSIIEQKHNFIQYQGIDEDKAFKKQLFVKFVDFPPSMSSRIFSPHSNIFTDILSKHYKLIISDNPDFLFYNVFGDDFKKYKDSVKIFFTDESIVPNFNHCDYAIGFDDLTFGDRYIRCPLYFLVMRKEHQYRENLDESLAQRKFCNFIYSNSTAGEGALLRQEFCKKLMEYKNVDCPGKVLNNMTDSIIPREGDWAKGKNEFMKNYKFTIAFESSSTIGYTTEKLYHSFIANSVPIYWGNPDVAKDFNPKAFVNATKILEENSGNFDMLVNVIEELDNNNEKYMAMLREPCMNPEYKFDKEKLMEEFLINIIEKGKKPFNKSPNPALSENGFVKLNYKLFNP